MEKDLEEAVRLYRLAVESGNMYAHACLGQCYAYGHGVEKDLKEAVRLIRLSANLGMNLGITCLAQLYEDGDGVEQDEAEAVACTFGCCRRMDRRDYVLGNVLSFR